MRQNFSAEPKEDELIEFSAEAKSDLVRINVQDTDYDSAEIEVSVKDAKVIRDQLNKAIGVAENPYPIIKGTIDFPALSPSYLDLMYGSFPKTPRTFF